MAFVIAIGVYLISFNDKSRNAANDLIDTTSDLIDTTSYDIARMKSEKIKLNNFMNKHYIDSSNLLKSFMVMRDEFIINRPITMDPDYVTCDVIRCKFKYNFNDSLVLKRNISNVDAIYSVGKEGVSYLEESLLPQSKINIDKVVTCQDTMSYLTILEQSRVGDIVYGDKKFPLDTVSSDIYDGASKLSELNVSFSVPKSESLFFTKSLGDLSVYPVNYKLDEDRWYLDTKVFCFD